MSVRQMPRQAFLLVGMHMSQRENDKTRCRATTMRLSHIVYNTTP